ncbi:MAG: RidA family protein [Thermoflexibacter sp.]|jgi:enamine deaminase RidA (YjgF/YER057c/UK114 family)|nr:RidA family protein [Thermoflexibacter sp.]
MKAIILIATITFLLISLFSCKPQEQVKRYDNSSSQILQGVEIPANKKLFFSSGIVAPVLDSTSNDTYKRYGDTYTQSINTLKRIEDILKKAGLGLKDVVFLKIYIAPDPNKNKDFDFAAWFRAYQVFFNNPQNPVKVARTTLGTAALARPELLVEIEAIAVYP